MNIIYASGRLARKRESVEVFNVVHARIEQVEDIERDRPLLEPIADLTVKGK